MIVCNCFPRIGPDHERKRDGKDIDYWKFFKIQRIEKMKQDENQAQKKKINGKK